MHKFRLFLIDKLGFSEATYRVLLQIRDAIIVTLVTFILCIDWDKVLDQLGY